MKWIIIRHLVPPTIIGHTSFLAPGIQGERMKMSLITAESLGVKRGKTSTAMKI
jgi:hypothetical protein